MLSRSCCRRFVLAGFTLILTAEAAATLLAAEPAAVRRPNVIFLLVDDLRWDALGCTGNKVVHSPNIDAFAKQGARFEEAYSSSPWTKPSIGTIFTGLVPLVHRATAITGTDYRAEAQSLRPIFATLAERFKELLCGIRERISSQRTDRDTADIVGAAPNRRHSD